MANTVHIYSMYERERENVHCACISNTMHTISFSMALVSIIIVGSFSSQIIRQKSDIVLGKGPTK